MALTYKHFKPEEAPEPTGPSKEDLLMQIESDHYAAKQQGDTDEVARLEDRHKEVSKASSVNAARKAYDDHVKKPR